MGRADRILEEGDFLYESTYDPAQPIIRLTRKEYDSTLPWSEADIKMIKKIKNVWSVGGVSYYPKTTDEERLLRKVFKNK